jgi:hypothetical protein
MCEGEKNMTILEQIQQVISDKRYETIPTAVTLLYQGHFHIIEKIDKMELIRYAPEGEKTPSNCIAWVLIFNTWYKYVVEDIQKIDFEEHPVKEITTEKSCSSCKVSHGGTCAEKMSGRCRCDSGYAMYKGEDNEQN